MKEHITIDIYKNNTINNIYYFIYNKHVWEPHIVYLLNKYLKNKTVMLGSPDTDIHTYDIIIQNEYGNLFGCDIKIAVTSEYFGKNSTNWTGKFIRCLAINNKFKKEMYTAKAKNTHIIFWADNAIWVKNKADLINCKSYGAYRGNVFMYEYLLSDINAIKVCDISNEEFRQLIHMKHILDNASCAKQELPVYYTEEQKIEMCYKVCEDLKLTDKYEVHVNIK